MTEFKKERDAHIIIKKSLYLITKSVISWNSYKKQRSLLTNLFEKKRLYLDSLNKSKFHNLKKFCEIVGAYFPNKGIKSTGFFLEDKGEIQENNIKIAKTLNSYSGKITETLKL